jgi:phosphodiesterase/alkaline phosphatase D-like protein
MKRMMVLKMVVMLVLSLFLNTGCKKHEIPVVTTTAVSNITVDGVTTGGNVTSDGNEGVTARGVCYGSAATVTVTDPHTTNGTGTGIFTSTVTGLMAGTTYYVRAYATNSEGTGYGTALSFKTLGNAPIVSTLDATAVQTTGATLNGLVNANYLSTTVTFEYGLTTSYGSTATASQSPVTGSTSTNVSAVITGLNPGATYHFRVKTVNSIGTTYGDDKTFLTLGQAPTATTVAATDILTTSATFNGTVNANLVSSTVTFEYGLTTAYATTIAATQSPVTGSTVTNVSANVTNLTPGGVVYHFRVKAVNAVGTTYGSDLTVATLGGAPTATTAAATNVSGLTATVNGSVNANLVSTDVTFEYGLTTSYGSSAAAVPAIVTGSTLTTVAADLSGLTGATLYHFRIKAVNTAGTTYGDDLTFTTLGSAPAARTFAATNVLSTTATLNGTAKANWLPTDVTFEYGLSVSYGNSVTANQSPISGNTTININADLSGLTPSTLYYFRAKSVNALGTTYGAGLTFTTGAK